MARVVVDVPLAHLDRPFDYGVPEKFADTVQAGCRVRVRFSGQLVDGFVLETGGSTEFTGKLLPLAHVPSGEPVLTPQVARLLRAIADRYAGTMSDVLRLAVPPRRANAEKRPSPTPDALPGPPDPAGFARYPAGPALLSALAEGRPARAVWTALPGEDWPSRLAELCRAALSAGRGALVVVPDRKDLDRLEAAAGAVLPQHSFTVLRAGDTPEKRYRSFLAASRGAAQVVLGTRAAMFAPVRDLGLVVVWDDGDDLHSDDHAPYPHARDVLVQRAYLDNCAAVVAGTARTAEAALLVESGWAHELAADRNALRAASPRVQALGDDFELARDPAARSARLPSLAHEAARKALAGGAPVLVQVPRRGYVPSLSCARCRAPARCAHCAGPLGISPRPGPGGTRIPACRWCARPAATFDCPHCHGTKLRAAVVGESRTAEELARAFPGAVVRTSGSTTGVLSTVDAGPSLVVATPGAEPVAEGGYGAALLLDSWALLGRADLRAGEETLRRWMNAATLVRPASAGGHRRRRGRRGAPRRPGAGPLGPGVAGRARARRPPRARLPAGHPDRRRCRGRPRRWPSSSRRCACPTTPICWARCPSRRDPGQEGERERYLVRVPRTEGAGLAHALTEVQGVRSAKKVPEHVRVQLDPLDLV